MQDKQSGKQTADGRQAQSRVDASSASEHRNWPLPRCILSKHSQSPKFHDCCTSAPVAVLGRAPAPSGHLTARQARCPTFAAGPQAIAVTPASAQAQAAPVPTAAQLPPPRQHPGFQEPANEQERLETLHSLQILDTEPEARFDDITRIVKAVFKVQYAAITLVDKDRLWWGSAGACCLSVAGLAACMWHEEARGQGQTLAACVSQGQLDVCRWLGKLGWLMMPSCLEGQGWHALLTAVVSPCQSRLQGSPSASGV